MYLNDLMKKTDEDIRVKNILINILRITEKEEADKKLTSRKDTIKFLSDTMIREVRKTFK